MLEGTRPKECEYCWKIEDMEKDADGGIDRSVTGHLKHMLYTPMKRLT